MKRALASAIATALFFVVLAATSAVGSGHPSVHVRVKYIGVGKTHMLAVGQRLEVRALGELISDIVDVA